MRMLVVIPHYFGSADPANSTPLSASYKEPLSRIAALSETITSLHRNFGPYRSTRDGIEISPAAGCRANVLDILIVTMRGCNILAELGIDPGIYSVEYVEGPPTQIPFHAQRLLRERLGHYDFFCAIEHDIAIHDPDFFAKLMWFQGNFGLTSLLAPTRVETAATGTPGKVIIDRDHPENPSSPFRRPGQRQELQASWNGQLRKFRLATNPHAACYFLTQEQLAYWVEQPSFDDRDASWVGPVESAMTLGAGKVFDIYKAYWPDPFFLEVHHFGVAFAARNPPQGRRYGETPLLAIAESALRAALNNPKNGSDLAGSGGGALSQIVQAAYAEGTAGGRIAQRARGNPKKGKLRSKVTELTSRMESYESEIAMLRAALANAEKERRPQSLRWLLRSILVELSRRARFGSRLKRR